MSMDKWMDKQNVVYITTEYYSVIKEGNPAICNNLDVPWGHYAKWNELDRKREILYNFTYMYNLKKANSQIQRTDWLPETRNLMYSMV